MNTTYTSTITNMQVYMCQVKRKQTHACTLATDIILNWLGTYPVAPNMKPGMPQMKQTAFSF